MSKENTHVTGLAGQIKENMEVGENGVVNLTGNALELALRDGADLDSWALHEDIRSELVAAATQALGEVSMEAMGKDKNLDRTELTLSIGRDEVDLGFRKSNQYPNPKDPNNKITKYGVSSSTYKAYGSRNVADLKKVRVSLSEKAEALLK